MRITERRLRRIIRNIILEREEKSEMSEMASFVSPINPDDSSWRNRVPVPYEASKLDKFLGRTFQNDLKKFIKSILLGESHRSPKNVEVSFDINKKYAVSEVPFDEYRGDEVLGTGRVSFSSRDDDIFDFPIFVKPRKTADYSRRHLLSINVGTPENNLGEWCIINPPGIHTSSKGLRKSSIRPVITRTLGNIVGWGHENRLGFEEIMHKGTEVFGEKI